jgi:nicotinate-nucleotide pyrophosphorylase (carboxylating)
MLDLTRSGLEDTLKSFIAEDLGHGDITTNALVDPNKRGEGRVVCKENAVIAGLEEALLLLRLAGCQGTSKLRDGDHVRAGSVVISAKGPARGLLGIERTLLNLLSHMSGVATATANLVSIAKKAGGTQVRIACTRKTLPGLRYFEKKAVELGGGDTHRLGLDDAVLIKDNHLALTGTITESVRKARAKVSFTKKVEVEVTSSVQAIEAAEARADIVLLDNMTPDEVQRALNLLKAKNLRNQVLVEASGGITNENIARYARTWVDVISVGAITNSAKAIDMSMKIHATNRRA